jgi:hypothetical protein
VVYTTTSVVETVVPTTIDIYTTEAPETISVETFVYSTSTSLCPITETQTVSGQEITVVYTSTSLIEIKVPTTIVEYTTEAPETISVETFVYSTSTSLCPITEIQTVSGQEITVVYTSTSLIEVKVPTTIVEYTTVLTTCFETTEVYQTTTCFETDYTTVSAGSTVVIRKSQVGIE